MARGRGTVEGGVNISNSKVITNGGHIVGHDLIERDSLPQLDLIFQSISTAIANADATAKAAADIKLQELKGEIAKGGHADDSTVAKLIEGLVGLVPGAVGAVVGAFATPILGGIAGPVTKYVLSKIQRT
ncbi:MAG: hypothetical protein AB1586_31750 [Pseudomonadota bacterium]